MLTVTDATFDARLRARLLGVVAVIAALGLAVELWAWRALEGDALVEPAWTLLSLSGEGNLPTWLASSLLLGCALAAGAIAGELPVGAPWRRHWWGVAAGLAFVSMDEVVGLHEQLGGTFGTGGVLYFDWVLIAGPVVAALALVYLPFVRALPAPVRGRLVVAAVVFVSGALVMELPLGWWTERAGTHTLGYALIDWVEETLELVGTCLALVALVAHRRSPHRPPGGAA